MLVETKKRAEASSVFYNADTAIGSVSETSPLER